jgi:hypothetical protein
MNILASAIRRALGFAVLILASSACQTLPPPPKPVLPAAVAGLFSSCGPGDGAVTLQLYADGALAGSLETSWMARSADEWQVELIDPLGRTMLKVHNHGTRLDFAGPLAARMPTVSVDAAGTLALSGHPTGIQLREVPCLLAFTYPKAWLSALAEREGEGGKVRYLFRQPERSMELEVSSTQPSGPTCTDIFWREYLILSRKLTWCLSGTKRRKASLVGLSDYKLTWVQIDD